MESTATYARPELLQVADTVARDKGIDRDEVLEAMEQVQRRGRGVLTALGLGNLDGAAQ